MTAETTFPLYPVAEETLAAMTEIRDRLTQPITTPPYPLWAAGAQPWTAWDECLPVTAQACAALVTGWLDEAVARIAAAMPWRLTVLPASPPVAEPVHDDPAAVPEGGAAAVDLPRPELQRPPDSDGPAVDRAAGPGQPDCDPGSAAVQHVLAVMNARGGRPDQDDTQDGTAKPDQTAVMEPLTEAQIIAVTDSTEGDEQA